MSRRVFRDRREAGRALSDLLAHHRGHDAVVLGLPRGGVPVAFEVAIGLDATLDVFVVRKLGVPGREELAMGAVASGGSVVTNDDVVQALHIAPEVLQRVIESETSELLRREHAYREGRPMVEVGNRTVILVDDGLATGASMRAAIRAVRSNDPASVVMAVPAGPPSTCRQLALEVEEVVCATTPKRFVAVGASYANFTQVTDEEVRDLLRAAADTKTPLSGRRPGTPHNHRHDI